jgi:nickel/cobalt transporter (NicO) family protein
MKRFWFRLTSLIGLVSLLLSLPALAQAHALDEHLQLTYLTIKPQQVIVELNMTPGVLVAPGIITALDTDGDRQISAAEGQIYAQTVVSKLVLQLDGQPLSLTITSIEMPPYLNLQVGYGLIKIFAEATLPANLSGAHRLYYKNNYVPEGAKYQVNAFVEQNAPVKLAAQDRDEVQQSINVGYELTTPVKANAPAVVSSSAVTVTSGAATGQLNELFGVIGRPELSPWLLLIALGLAMLLGGLHALTPGHGCLSGR